MKYLICFLLLASIYYPAKAQGNGRDSLTIYSILQLDIPDCLKKKDFVKLGEMLAVDFIHTEYIGDWVSNSARGRAAVLKFYESSYQTVDLESLDMKIMKLTFSKNKAVVNGTIHASFKDKQTLTILAQNNRFSCRLEKSADQNWRLKSISHYYQAN